MLKFMKNLAKAFFGATISLGLIVYTWAFLFVVNASIDHFENSDYEKLFYGLVILLWLSLIGLTATILAGNTVYMMYNSTKEDSERWQLL